MRQPIIYRQFWDVPRLFALEHRGDVYVFECDFDEQLDDYPPNFKVYRLPKSTLTDFSRNAFSTNSALVGEIIVSDVKFDKTRRKEVDTDCLAKLKR